MIQKVVSPYPLNEVDVAQLPGGQTDVWLRTNITTKERPGEGEGQEGYTVYTADEAYIRCTGAITAAYAGDHFSDLWSLAEGYNPATDKGPTPQEQWQTDTDAAIVELAGLLDELLTGGE